MQLILESNQKRKAKIGNEEEKRIKRFKRRTKKRRKLKENRRRKQSE